MFQTQKPNPKIRFQNRAFKQQLQNARHYKRTPIKLPDKQWQIFLGNIGLGTWWAKTLAVLFVLFAFYLIYVPNLFYLKQIDITGFKTEGQDGIRQDVAAFAAQNKLWPQRNLLLLSKKSLSDYLLEKRPDILKVISVKKNWPHTLALELEQRVNKYLVEIGENKFLVSNDGKVIGQADNDATSSNLTLIKLGRIDGPQTGDYIFSEELLKTINALSRELPEAARSPIAYYALDKNDSPDLDVFTATGLKLIFDVKLNTQDSLKRLRLLMSNLPDVDKSRLYYIDMRFENKSYVCYKNTPCTKDMIITTSFSTTTPSSTPAQ